MPVVRRLGTMLLLLVASPALADTTAVYSTPGGEMTMTIEIASNGDLHGSMGGKMLDEAREKLGKPVEMGFLSRGGEGYFIQTGPAGVTVINVNDAAAVIAESLKDHPEARPPSGEDGAPLASPKLVPLGPVTVNGRLGTGYGFENAGHDPRPGVVLSTDSDLIELRDAMARQFQMSTAMGKAAFGWNAGSDMAELLKTGAPLRFAGMELVSVKHDPIPAARFELPAAPLSRDAVRTSMVPGPAAAAPPSPRP